MNKEFKIVTIEKEEILRKSCSEFSKGKVDYINNLIHSMVKLMIENNGCGIAAPQVGVNKRLFIAVLDNERIEVFMHPVILSHSEDTEIATEGCLSVPGMCGDVERYKTVKIRYFNGRQFVTAEYEGLNARIVQHEFDHLNGTLYIDKAHNVREVQTEATA